MKVEIDILLEQNISYREVGRRLGISQKKSYVIDEEREKAK